MDGTCWGHPRRPTGPHGLELFAGSGRLSKAVAAKGLPMIKYELADGPASDLAKTRVQNSVLADIRSGMVKLVWIGLPCTTFSRARRGVVRLDAGQETSRMPRALRSSDLPWGLPNLNLLDQHRVDVGNSLLKFAIQVIRTCLRHGVHFVLENPRTSIVWHCDSLMEVMARRSVQRVEVDFCRFGVEWRKGTSLLSNWTPLATLANKCRGRRGLCGATGQPHRQLSGKDSSGTWWTKRAVPFNLKLVN